MKTANSSSWLLSAAVLALSIAAPADAQITPDATLPNNSVVLPNGNIITIEGGTQAGTNLFHSFQEFSIPTGGEAFFNNATSIDNIITRVTGGNLSDIDGLIRANGTANLFLLNPNGIQFGPNASLEIGGSFLGSTADRVLFEDGSFYSATQPNQTPLLKIDVPVGLQFGASPGEIQLMGTGQRILTNENPLLDPLSIVPLVRTSEPANLEVSSGQTLALVGGNITLQGSALRANEGRIELGSVRRGVVGLESIPSGWILDYSSISDFQDITLVSQSAIDASGFTSQGIQLAGRQIQLRDSSLVLMQVLGAAPTANVRLSATESIDIAGSAPNSLQPSAIGIENLGSGQTGDVTIVATDLVAREGGGIGITHAGTNRGSNVNVEVARSIFLSGRSPGNPNNFSGLGINIIGSGDGGNVNVSTGNLTLENGAAIGSITVLGIGSGGDVIVNATDSISLLERGTSIESTINASTLGAGNAGRIFIDTPILAIEGEASIGTSTLASGNAGEITINASESVEITRFDGLSAITSAVRREPNLQPIKTILGLPDVPVGNGGSIAIVTPSLSISGFTNISVSNDGTGVAGDLDIHAGSISLDRQASLAAASFSGEGGNITLQGVDSLQLRNGSQITAESGGIGNGGNITFDASTIALLENSSITANAFEGTGGNIDITTLGLFVSPDSRITASSELGVDGVVTINNPIIDPASGLVALDGDTLNPNTQIQDSCKIAARSRFVFAGSGGLPEDPTQPLQAQTVWRDTRLGEIDSNLTPNAREEVPSESAVPPAPLIEATGWITNDEGQIELIVASGNPSHSSWQPHPECNTTTQGTPHSGSFEQK